MTILMPTALNDALVALLEFRLMDWGGLPPCVTSDVSAILGPPDKMTEAYLGAYPALCETYPAPDSAAGGLVVYSRADRVMAVETAEPPHIEAMKPLGDPDIRKPPEFSLAGYSVREFLYFRRGLVLSVGQALTPDVELPLKIARCRGIRTLAAPHEYGAEYYLALKNRVLFEKT